MPKATFTIRAICLALPAVVLCLTAAAAAFADAPAQPAAWSWAGREQFDQCYRDRYLDSLSDPAAVKLVHQIVIADEMGKEYNEYQPVTGKTQAKKILMLDDADVSHATLFVGGSSADCELLVNGTVLGVKPPARTYWTGEFDQYAIPPKLLKKGTNEFVFRAPAGKQGSIRIENCQQPGRSAVSHDGGASWDFEHLAEGGFCKGEFEVRLNIGRYAPHAWLRSPVLDLASRLSVNGLPVAVGGSAHISDIAVDADIPQGTSVETMVRTGATPDGYEENWSRWYAWPAERQQVKFERFAQWQVTLHTSVAQKTPTIRGVAVETATDELTGQAFVKALRIDSSANQKIVRSSYDFAYGDYDGNLKVLRKNWDLAGVVTSGSTQIDKLKLLRQWTREQWKNGWDMGALNYIPSWDARIILTLAPKKLSLGMCTHYATTFVQCSQALGYTSRSIFWGHALSESWSDEQKKWMVMDAGCDSNDGRRSTYNFERNGTLLSQLEVHKAYYIDKNWKDIKMVATNMSLGSQKVEEPFENKAEELMKSAQEIFMPLRNNFVDHREPEEPEHGQGYFKFLGFILWKDAATPEVPWTDFFTTREADLYWTLDQAQVFLSAPTSGDKPQLNVTLDTVTPNFAGYEYRVDGKEWMKWDAPAHGAGAAAAGANGSGVKAYPMKPTGGCIELPWAVHAGKNTLEARPFNKAGHRGIVSTVVVEAAM